MDKPLTATVIALIVLDLCLVPVLAKHEMPTTDMISNSVNIKVWELERAFDVCRSHLGLYSITAFTDGQENLAECGNGRLLGMDIPLNQIKPL